ncbi:ribose 5-phosphate isomerase B [Flavihumibacter profundi]|jgi:ribose 5-phosphate isomerase B|uniref:ribose 5-phosphate isomerase B n=1 Tax=Flavihumibacter profundi TaxID=2716883 RepID=UPI001CC42842|nr:ribose 5-phosphate isomerase B [Flavihumibacter profundi]MBZ5857475.1 ribose 5-phosphate isomerase B [Flavihumibacter profundi]
MSDFSKQLPIAIGCDHAGYAYKELIKNYLLSQGWRVNDFGTNGPESVDYPDFAHPTADSVEQGKSAFGILICGSANGVAITANKHAGIRAGLCWTNDVAQLVRQHNNANMLCLPARFLSEQEVIQLVNTFIETPFEGGRHATRVNKIGCS